MIETFGIAIAIAGTMMPMIESLRIEILENEIPGTHESEIFGTLESEISGTHEGEMRGIHESEMFGTHETLATHEMCETIITATAGREITGTRVLETHAIQETSETLAIVETATHVTYVTPETIATHVITVMQNGEKSICLADPIFVQGRRTSGAPLLARPQRPKWSSGSGRNLDRPCYLSTRRQTRSTTESRAMSRW